jgi:hypothetical protein
MISLKNKDETVLKSRKQNSLERKKGLLRKLYEHLFLCHAFYGDEEDKKREWKGREDI